MCTLIIIPARKGSQRLKRKNKKLFLGKPLIQHTIDFAKKLKITKNILVTTDDPDILLIAKKNKILAPWLRPSKISTSEAKSTSFLFHALKWFKTQSIEMNTVILLQPTSPFRSVYTFKKMLNIYQKNKKSVVTVTTQLKDNKNVLYMLGNTLSKKKNKNNKFLKVNIVGNIYINSVKNIKKYNSFVNKDTIPYIIKVKKQLVDIDTKKDFQDAKKLD